MPIKAGNQRKYFEFALWAIALGRPPSRLEICGFFGISRSGAARVDGNWKAALKHHRESQAPAATGQAISTNRS